jgi:hypothetical protein
MSDGESEGGENEVTLGVLLIIHSFFRIDSVGNN